MTATVKFLLDCRCQAAVESRVYEAANELLSQLQQRSYCDVKSIIFSMDLDNCDYVFLDTSRYSALY